MVDRTTEPPSLCSRWQMLLALLLVTVVVRAGVVARQYDHLSSDPDAYRLIAENLVQHGVYSRSLGNSPPQPTAFRPPLYPLLLAAISRDGRVTPIAVAILHVAVGIATVLLTLAVAGRWHLGRGRWIAGAGVACDPILLNQSPQVMTETLATLLAVFSLWIMTRFDPRRSSRGAFLTGLVLGTAALCRPTFLVWAVLVVGYIAWHDRSSQQQNMRRAGIIAVGIIIMLLPWIARNWRALQKPVIATTHGGYTLLLGNNPFFYDYLRSHRAEGVWDARQLQTWLAQQPEFTRAERTGGPAEIEADRYLQTIALQTIRREPKMFMYACAVRLARLWSPLPHQVVRPESVARRVLRYTVAVWYLSLYGVMLVVVACRFRALATGPWFFGLLLIVAFSAVHTIYWSNLRMRAPLMPVIYLAAAAWPPRDARPGTDAIS